MGLQRFSDKKVRRISSEVDTPLRMVWGGSGHYGGQQFQAVTRDHVHGIVDREYEVFIPDEGVVICTTSCPGNEHFNPEEWLPPIGTWSEDG